MIRFLTLTTTVTLTFSGCLIAQEQGGRGARRGQRPLMHPLVRVIDGNGDGTVTRDEWEQAPELWKKLDRDGDFTLTRREMSPEGPALRSEGERRGGRRRGAADKGAIDIPIASVDLGEPGIAWYGRLDLAKQEARRSNRPIMFMAAASQCGGVPGVF